MKVTASWLTDSHAQRLMAIFDEAGEEAYFVGGCVRNSLLGVSVSDLDVSTSARPERVMALARNAGFKAIPTGIEHGTVTLVVDGEPFEVTTYRRDVETDGRRAVVAFSDQLEDDAHRRDFTMNALYAAADGTVTDPLGGLTDLKARRVRFIDDPDARIREDYLRILRFFRFHAWYGDQDAGLDADGLAACSANLAGLETLSRERVGSELIKLLSARAPDRALGAMDQSGVLNILLPGASTRALFLLTEMEQAADPIVRLAALGDFDLAMSLRLSKSQIRQYAALRNHIAGTASVREIAYRDGGKMAWDVAGLRAAVFEQPLSETLRDDIDLAEAVTFPIQAKDLMPQMSGAILGTTLRQLEQSWIDSGFQMSREALLAQAKRV